jgi:hypothetical protein
MATSTRSRFLGVVYGRAVVRHLIAGTLHVSAGVIVAFAYWTRPGVASLAGVYDPYYGLGIPTDTVTAWWPFVLSWLAFTIPMVIHQRRFAVWCVLFTCVSAFAALLYADLLPISVPGSPFAWSIAIAILLLALIGRCAFEPPQQTESKS